MLTLSEKQKSELTEEVGKLLVAELETQASKDKVKKIVSDFIKKNKLDIDSPTLLKALDWHVKVLLKA